MENVWRYSVNMGEFGGVVIADCLIDAYNKVKKKYGNGSEIEVWQFLDDGYYDEDNQDVVECYGIEYGG